MSDLNVRIRELMAAGKKIEAIRLLREATGVDLAEAKRLVESTTAEESGSDDNERELLELLRQGEFIRAIKRHREQTQQGLKESKEFVEALAARHGIVISRPGCLGVLVAGLLLALALAMASACAGDPPKSDEPTGTQRATVDAPIRSTEGWLIHSLKSEFQAGPTEIKVLLPDRLELGKRYPVLYVLPVEANNEHRYGDGLAEIKRSDIHNKHALICVAPTFSHLPWYADHPTDKSIRQESYFVKSVVPLLDRMYPTVARAEGRWLLGFSKSGWGAWRLLARHPQLFGRAAAWDAPMDMSRFDQYGAAQVFGNQEYFDSCRVLPALRQCKALVAAPARLVLTGYDNFRDQHIVAHQRLEEWQIPHIYRDGPQRKHVWDSGWVEEAVELLAGLKAAE